MSEHLGALEKLVGMKERGLLSDEEFESQKQALLSGKKPKKPWTFWRVVKTVLLWWIILCALWVGLGSFVSAPADEVASCDNSDVQQKVTFLVNQQTADALSVFGAGAGADTRVSALANVVEIRHDKASGYRACTAKTVLPGKQGQGNTAYTIEWRDKQKGEYWIQLVDPSAIRN